MWSNLMTITECINCIALQTVAACSLCWAACCNVGTLRTCRQFACSLCWAACCNVGTLRTCRQFGQSLRVRCAGQHVVTSALCGLVGSLVSGCVRCSGQHVVTSALCGLVGSLFSLIHGTRLTTSVEDRWCFCVTLESCCLATAARCLYGDCCSTPHKLSYC